MGKYIEKTGNKDEIIKTEIDTIINNINNSKYELSIDKNKYSILEYTEEYIKDLFNTIDKVNYNWENLLKIAKTYHEELNYKCDFSFNGVSETISAVQNISVSFKKGIVNTTNDYLNIRSGPNGKIISSIPPETEVKILEDDQDGWTKISIGDTEGYVCSRYITTDVPLEVIDYKVVDTNSLAIRNYPNGNIISSLPYNSEVEILSDSHNGWTKILYDGKIAYVDSKGLKNEEEL